ncbi:MAG: hypothetical protein JOZ79_00240 [Sphingomonas sp.]|nr:hypothetical protein [Sphingomonas sp.]
MISAARCAALVAATLLLIPSAAAANRPHGPRWLGEQNREGSQDRQDGPDQQGGPPMPPPFMNLKGSVQDRTIGPLRLGEVYRGIDTDKGASLHNVTITGIDARSLQRSGIRIRGDAIGVRIQNFHLQMDPVPQTSPNLPSGIAIGVGQNISISDGTISGFQMVRVPGKYTNGDGIASERTVDGLSITNVSSTDNSDGGFDLKSQNTKLDGLTSERNGRNYRLWGTVDAGTLTSSDPRDAHIWVGQGADIHIRHLIASSSTDAPLIKIGGPSRITIDRCTLHLQPGTQIVGEHAEEAEVHLGPGCSR